MRICNPEDLRLIAAMTCEALEELGKEHEYSLVLDKVIDSYGRAPTFILDDKGFAGLTVYKEFWSGEKILTDYMFYLRPQHRGLKNIKALCDAAKAFADSNNLTLRLQFICTDKKEARERLLKLCGFEVVSLTGEYNGRW